MDTTDAPHSVPAGASPISRAGLVRVGLHLLLAALPLLAISAHVFGLIRMNSSAALLVIPLATTIVALSIFAPKPEDRVILHGFVWGIVACGLYDVFRLDTVYMLGWWADFIPTMGTWIVGNDDLAAGAVVGYLWRYLGDGGGIGVTFFVGAAFLGLHHRPARQVVAAAVAFAVFPVWSGLIATVAIAPRGQTMMFPLTPTTITLSLIGHLIFGLILGLGFVKSRSAQTHWPWTPLIRTAPSPSSRATSAAAAFPEPTSERTNPRLPQGHPSAPLPRQQAPGPRHPSGPLPTSAVPTSLSFGVPTGGEAGATNGRTTTGPTTTGAAHARTPTADPATGSTRVRATDTGSTRIRGGSRTPPGGQTLDPETWALWQRQLETTVKGRRTHRWR